MNADFFKMAKRLKTLREDKELSNAKLADALKQQYGISISKDSLQSYEVSDLNSSKVRDGQLPCSKMNTQYIACISDFYGVSNDYLLGVTDIKDRNQNVREICDSTGLCEWFVNYLFQNVNDIEKMQAWNTFLSPNLDRIMWRLIEMRGIKKHLESDIQRIEKNIGKCDSYTISNSRESINEGYKTFRMAHFEAAEELKEVLRGASAYADLSKKVQDINDKIDEKEGW